MLPSATAGWSAPKTWVVRAASRRCYHQRSSNYCGSTLRSFHSSCYRGDSQEASDYEDIPKWRPSKDDIVVNNLEATLEKHRKTIQSVRESIQAQEQEKNEDGSGVYRPVRPEIAPRKVVPPKEPEPENEVNEHLEAESETSRTTDAALNNEELTVESESLDEPKEVHPIRKAPVQGDKGYPVKPSGVWSYDTPGKHPKQFYPWFQKAESYDGDGMQQLGKEIESFEELMRFTSFEKLHAAIYINEIDDILRDHLSEYNAVLYGSHTTGLATPLSDVDVCIYSPEGEAAGSEHSKDPTHPQQKKAKLQVLASLREYLKQGHRYSEAKLVYAKVPLLAARKSDHGIKVQVSIGSSISAPTEFTKYFLAEHRDLRPLFILLKMALKMRGLDEVFTGGIGSYTLLVMILTALTHPGVVPKATAPAPVEPATQISSDPISTEHDSTRPITSPAKSLPSSTDSTSSPYPSSISPSDPLPESLPARLLHVLKFWSTANTKTHGFSADPPRLFPKFHRNLPPDTLEPLSFPNDIAYREGIVHLARQNRLRPRASNKPAWAKSHSLLSLQDPADPFNDLGAKSHQFKNVQATFGWIKARLEERLKIWDEMPVENRHKNVAALLIPAVGANWDHVVHMRTISDRWGYALERGFRRLKIIDGEVASVNTEKKVLDKGKTVNRQVGCRIRIVGVNVPVEQSKAKAMHELRVKRRREKEENETRWDRVKMEIETLIGDK